MTFTQHSYPTVAPRTARKQECARRKSWSEEIKYVSAPVNRRESALARSQDAIFKCSGRKRENRGVNPISHLVPKETLKWFVWMVFKSVFLSRLVLQKKNDFLTLKHVLLGNREREQPDVADEGAPGVGSGEWSFVWQRAVWLDHKVHS